jgi:hypothetical protein
MLIKYTIWTNRLKSVASSYLCRELDIQVTKLVCGDNMWIENST